ncbi:glycerophosphodiester phosphodiesterase [Pyruvatibacter sp.]|uniref:glycerophosphodiester phosphodiesterase n=1 Tax=Pyruvatibacter sp. TaxID=1981328 RepID=UPI0032F021FE
MTRSSKRPVRPARYAYLEHDGILAFAHRGGAVDFPENTMAAFEAAVGMGYRYLETDAYATRDGVLLSFHDDRLDRVTSHSGAIEELDYAQVAPARIEGREPIPLMEDLIGSFPDARFNIDPKHDACVGPLIDVIRRTNAVERVCVGSFSDKRIGQLRDALGPKLCTSMGPWATTRMRFSAWGVPVGRFTNVGAAQIPVVQFGVTLGNQSFVERCHDHGLQVHIWTIDDPVEMNRLLDMGVDGLMTDRPAVLRDVLQKRGLWA